MRPLVTLQFYPFATQAQGPYSDGQDSGDLRAFKKNINDYRFMRIAACNGVEFADFPSDNPLPLKVVPTGNMLTTKDAKKQLRKLTIVFEGVDRA